MTNEKSYEAIINSFCRWYNGEVFSEEQKQWLSNNTNIDEYNDIREFYREMGFQNEDGTLTEIGKESLKAWKQDAGSKTAPTVGTQKDPNDDRRESWEAERITAEEWENNNYYAVEIHTTDGIPLDDRTKHKRQIAVGYDDYAAARDFVHENNWFICSESFQTEQEYFPGLLTIDDYVKTFEDADDDYLRLPSFPKFSQRMKIKTHDTIILAADTGAGKSSLAINFLNDLNDRYPVLYVNLEMDRITILRRLVAIRTGLEIDRIEGYKKDERTRDAVNSALRFISSRKPLQLIEDVYYLEHLEKVIAKSTEGREEPTIVIIDHALLLKTKERNNGSYERATAISEGLRRISRKYNIIMFSLLQQNRAGKGDGDDTKRPTNNSLKNSGSWENDSTHVIFLWFDPEARKKKIIITKNRSGDHGDFVLNYWKKTQTYSESKDQNADDARDLNDLTLEPTGKQSKRDKKRAELEAAFKEAVTRTGGNVTLKDLAEVMDVTTGTVKRQLKEYGGYSIDGQPADPAGVSNIIESSFIRLTPAEDAETPFQNPPETFFGYPVGTL